MSLRRELRQGGASADPLVRNAEQVAPGRVSLTDLIQRKPDGNGVEPHAEAAVATAASSSGAPLPTALQRKFESSLGVDLSGVRIHTGGDSVGAARAVGARAYAVGNDIHFNAGQYNPESAEGEHLIAHEVAHTVQQSGVARRAQYKLEVSQPGDYAEREADLAASAMVRTEPARVSVAGGIARVVARDYSSNLDKAGDEGERQARAAAPDRVLSISTVEDKESAEKCLHLIESLEPDMEAALETGDAKAGDLSANNAAKQQLSQYLSSMEGNNLAISNFKGLYKRVQVDYARLDSMAQKAGSGLTAKNQAANGQGVSVYSGQDLAKDHLDNAAGKNGGADALAARAHKLADGDPEIRNALKSLQDQKEPLEAQQKKVSEAEKGSTRGVDGINAARNGILSLESKFKSKSLKAKFAKAKQEVEEAKESVNQLCEVLAGAAEVLADPEKAAETIATKAMEKLGPILSAAGALPSLDLTEEEKAEGEKAEVANDLANVQAYDGAKSAYRVAISQAQSAVSAFVNEVKELDKQKTDHKRNLTALGAKLDAAEAKQPGAKKRKPGELGAFEQITTFLAEADAFIADANAAKQVGEQENAEGGASQQHAVSRWGVEALNVRIPCPYEVKEGEEPKRRFKLKDQSIGLHSSGEDANKTSSVDQASSTIKEACAAIDKYVHEIDAYRTELRKALGA